MRPIRQTAVTLVALLAASAFVLLPAVPVAAHDQLIESDPASGERVAAAPETVSLTFSEELLTIGAAVIVIDEAGDDWATGEPDIQGSVVRMQLDPDMPNAGYEIRWQVVSSDGHPISGIVPFVVGDGPPFTRIPAASPGAPVAGSGESQESSDSSGVLRVLLVGGIGAAVAGGAFLLILFLRRRARGAAAVPPAE